MGSKTTTGIYPNTVFIMLINTSARSNLEAQQLGLKNTVMRILIRLEGADGVAFISDEISSEV